MRRAVTIQNELNSITKELWRVRRVLQATLRCVERREMNAAQFRLRVAQYGDRYVALVLEQRGLIDKWCLHATIGGMTMTEAREFAKVCGIRLEDAK
jgi:hypothetical protein